MSTSTVSATPNPIAEPLQQSTTSNNPSNYSTPPPPPLPPQSPPQLKKSSLTPSPATRTQIRTRKLAPSTALVKHSKPRWKTIISVFVNNLMLVLVVLGLVQMIKKFVVKEDHGSKGIYGFSDMEGRISSVESSMKTTSKMLQVQVEVVDKKINSEFGNLRREIVRRVDEKGEEFEGKLIEFRAKSDNLEAVLRELKEVSKEFVSKYDVMRLYDELRIGKDGNLEGIGVWMRYEV